MELVEMLSGLPSSWADFGHPIPDACAFLVDFLRIHGSSIVRSSTVLPPRAVWTFCTGGIQYS